MAVIQISKIQVRRGAVGDQGMPQLASGEMAWAIDQQRLFIGNGSVAEGAPAVGNTEILTNFSTATINLFDCIYTYTGVNPGTTITTGVDSNHPIERTLQAKVDEIEVSVKDFGAVENSDITENLRRAIKQLYLNSDYIYPSSRRILRIPAGKYYVTGTNFVPAYATILGDGIDRTIVETITGKSIFATSATNGTSFTTNTTAVTQSKEVEFRGMTLQYASTVSVTGSNVLMVFDNALNSNVDDCKFAGAYTSSTGKVLTYAGIQVNGLSTLLAQNLTINNCHFENITQAIAGDNDTDTILIKNNTFEKLYKGIVFGENSSGLGSSVRGPVNSQAIDNKFVKIEKQAISVGKVNSTQQIRFSSFNNQFEDVGSDLTNDIRQSTAVMSLNGRGNKSINDRFNRFSVIQASGRKALPLVDGVSTVVQVTGKTGNGTIVASASTQTLFKSPYASTATTLSIDYTITKSGRSRSGTFTANASPTGVSYKDTYTYIGADDTNVVFKAELMDTESLGTPDSLTIKYNNAVAYGAGLITYTINLR
jgi:hypothetical protein